MRTVQNALASAECSSRASPAACNWASRAHMVADAVMMFPSIFTSRSCTSWKPPIGRPNCSRSFA